MGSRFKDICMYQRLEIRWMSHEYDGAARIPSKPTGHERQLNVIAKDIYVLVESQRV